MENIKSFFSPGDERILLNSIKEAESKTSGEIRIHIERKLGKEPLNFARKIFESLGMRNTELHNGVLFVLGVEDRQFAILGDDGINEKVPDNFWDNVKDTVISNFRQNQFIKGLSEGVKLAGEQLAEFFPHQQDDVNELPDAISYGMEKEKKK